jgi:hypothetical protein
MFGDPFFNDSLKKYIAIFGTLFNDIKIDRIVDGQTHQTLRVPLAFGQRDKLLARVTEDPTLSRPDSITLPRIAFELKGGPHYDAARKENTVGRILQKANNSSYSSVYRPVPYNLDFELTIYAKQFEDGNRIFEQIVPYFTPHLCVTANLLADFPDYKRDINIVLNSTEINPDEYGDFKKLEVLTRKLDFTLEGWFFGPVTTAGVIKIATTNFIIDWTSNTVAESVTVQPGVDANGNPTTLLANSIPVSQITEDMDFGYIVTITTGNG